MIFTPRGDIIIDEISSYYTDINKLCEYYHEIVGSCGIYFKSDVTSMRGVLYYDDSDFIGGGFQAGQNEKVDTSEVIEKLIDIGARNNFDITVYSIDQNDVYYWSSLFHARSMYSDLKSEFTDLSALVDKMKKEKLSGYIEVMFHDIHGGNIFYRNGEIIHCICTITENSARATTSEEGDFADLIGLAKKKSAIYNVKEIVFSKPAANEKIDDPVLQKVSSAASKTDTERLFQFLASLLETLRQVLQSKNPQESNFNLILKKKFVEKADEYDFLDPFAAEFQYDGSKVDYLGKTDLKIVAAAVIESSLELAAEYDLADLFKSKLAALKKEYPREMQEIGNGG